MELILVVFLLLMIAGYVFGKLVAWLHTRQKIYHITKQDIQAVQFELFEALDPIEFALLLRGTMSQDAIYGQLVYLTQQGYITLRRDSHTHLLYVTRNTSRISRSSITIQTLKAFSDLAHPLVFSFDVEELLNITRQSLRDKGWLKRNALRSTNEVIARYDRLLFIASIAMFSLLVLAAIIIMAFAKYMYSPLGYAFFYVCLGLLAADLIIIILGTFGRIFYRQAYSGTLTIRSIAPKYRKFYKNILGLYTYMKVSGLDTMTPQDGDLTFSDIDKLYPYAVSTGIDVEIKKRLYS